MFEKYPILKPVLIYLAVISAVSAIITVYDKTAAKLGKRRVPEKTLLLFSALGGSVCMLIVMEIIRHKTRKPKFMFGIPAIIVVQAALIIILLKYTGVI